MRFEAHVPGNTLDASMPVCVVLCAVGDEGFGLRRRVAAPLLREGVASVLVENPYYGSRRPSGQSLSLLRTVRDQFAMNCATVDELRSLLRWLHERGHPKIAAAGYSQGAMMASFGAALSDFPVACVPRAGAARAMPIFVEAALQKRFDWKALAAGFSSREDARQYFARCLEPVDVSRFPPPMRPDAAIIIGSRYDRYVAPKEVEALHRHWPGSRLEWSETGHLTGALMGATEHAAAITTVLGVL